MMPFSDEELVGAVKSFMPTVSGYIQSHKGSLRFLGAHNGIIYMELGGACNGCSMSTATTKMVIERKLRELIHPELVVESIFPGEEAKLPEGMISA